MFHFGHRAHLGSAQNFRLPFEFCFSLSSPPFIVLGYREKVRARSVQEVDNNFNFPPFSILVHRHYFLLHVSRKYIL